MFTPEKEHSIVIRYIVTRHSVKWEISVQPGEGFGEN